MRLLILGGTQFVGRSVAEEAIARGWPVTVFHRGRHEPPPVARVVHGDRGVPADLRRLGDGPWDLVVDTWTGAPSAVRDAARYLAGSAGRYAYVSSRSVYAFPTPAGAAEDAPLVDGDPDDGDPDDGDVDYPRAKRGGELAALAAFGDRCLLLRAGLILGPGENIGRLPWWLHRLARGGPVLAPGPPELPLQYVDVRDLARWLLDAAAAGLAGAYNVVSPPGHTTMEELLRTCVQVTGARAELRWAEPDRILAAGIEPWTQVPIWLPPGELHDTLHRGDVSRALAAGLRCRPVRDTATDTWAWLRRLDGPVPHRPDRPPVGLPADLEARFLAS